MPKEKTLKPVRKISERQLRRQVNEESSLEYLNIFQRNDANMDEMRLISSSDNNASVLSETSDFASCAEKNIFSENVRESCYISDKNHENATHPDESIVAEEPYNEPEVWYSSDSSESSELATADNESVYVEKPPVPTSEDYNLQSFLAQWAVCNRIPHVAISSLLKKLRQHPCHSHLPSDPRTLLKTPRSTITTDVHPGKYIHLGLARGLNQLLVKYSSEIDTDIELAIGIDGFPISKSSRGSLWPILGSIVGFNDVFMIGAYYGNEKPGVAGDFMRDFIQEAKDLCENGLSFQDTLYTCSIKFFVCDAPAKSFVLNVKGCTGYSSCTKCTIKGTYANGRICFPELTARERTDTDFRNKTDDDYHAGDCCLEEIPRFDIIKNVPLDYMHLVCLGVVRKLLYLWLFGDLKYRLPHRNVFSISNALEKLKGFIPLEFARKPRYLDFVKQWKATEYRQLLLYTGPIVLKDVLPYDVYMNFLTLHVAIRILCSTNTTSLFNYAHDLLKHFVTSFMILYGRHSASHNIHGLIHIVQDVKNLGILDSFSAFKFENYMQTLKRLLRKSDKPLQQIFRRYVEIENSSESTTSKKRSCKFEVLTQSSHYDGPLPDGCENPQYKIVNYSDFKLKVDSLADNCCGLVNGEIILVKNIVYDSRKGILVLTGNEYEEKNNFYTEPCDSSSLDMVSWKTVRVENMAFRRCSPKVREIAIWIQQLRGFSDATCRT
ncbi:uncharacterized protein [Neodiprion pinetum]|uniref:uncharacterized protein n=1 Tax=Neodiprion pinetum TaxID=441929 RepID=UPI003720E4C7